MEKNETRTKDGSYTYGDYTAGDAFTIERAAVLRPPFLSRVKLGFQLKQIDEVKIPLHLMPYGILSSFGRFSSSISPFTIK